MSLVSGTAGERILFGFDAPSTRLTPGVIRTNRQHVAVTGFIRCSLGTRASMVRVECYFDCGSPFGYLGLLNLHKLASRLGIEVEWKPVVVGFVFAASNPDV